MGWIKDKFKSWLDIRPGDETTITIAESFTYEQEVYKNQLWYRGDPAELHQFYTQIDDKVNNTNFWQAKGTTGINFRKIHSGLPALIVDVLVDIVMSDLVGIKVNETAAQERWNEISKDNNFEELLKTALCKTMVDGDGAFKITYDPEITKIPIIEFYSGPRVDYEVVRGRLVAVEFVTEYSTPQNKREKLILEERYKKEGITYNLVDRRQKEYPLNTIPSLEGLQPIVNPNNFMLAIPFMLESSPKWAERGKSLYANKSGAFDAFDEVFSQWMDALRDGRSTRYIPDKLVPRNPRDGTLMRPNSFDNRYISTGSDMAEGAKNQIEVKQGEIPHEALLATYTTALDLCLQGLVSPSTLGIDVKKLDNAEAQREKEKATLYTRNKIVNALEKLVPDLVSTALRVDDMLQGKTPGEYEVSVSFGEYANPSFEAQVETMSKARGGGPVISIERVVEELYGDSLTEDEKAEEVQRLKDELGIVSVEDDFTEEEPPGGLPNENISTETTAANS